MTAAGSQASVTSATSNGEQVNSLHGMEVLVLVLAFDKEPYRTIEARGQRATWAASALPHVPVLFYYGITRGLAYWSVAIVTKALHLLRQRRLRRLFLRRRGARYILCAQEMGDRIYVNVPDTFGNISAKTIGALRHVLARHKFDYLFRTNTSSYVFLPLLQKFIQSLPQAGYYAGLPGQAGNMHFASGAGILLSRDLVEVAAGDDRWDWDLMDDVALARSMARAGVRLQALPRIEVLSPDQVALVPPDLWRTCFHARCRSTSHRLQDIDTMKRVHAAYLKAWRP